MGNFYLFWQSVGQVGNDQESLTSDLQFITTHWNIVFQILLVQKGF